MTLHLKHSVSSTRRHESSVGRCGTQQLMRCALAAPIFTQAATAAPNDVVVGGKSIGQDPDANVRLQMRRDAGSEGF